MRLKLVMAVVAPRLRPVLPSAAPCDPCSCRLIKGPLEKNIISPPLMMRLGLAPTSPSRCPALQFRHESVLSAPARIPSTSLILARPKAHLRSSWNGKRSVRAPCLCYQVSSGFRPRLRAPRPLRFLQPQRPTVFRQRTACFDLGFISSGAPQISNRSPEKQQCDTSLRLVGKCWRCLPQRSSSSGEGTRFPRRMPLHTRWHRR